MTIAEKILAAHAGVSQVRPGELILAHADLALGNDITAPVAIAEFRKCATKVRHPEKIALVLDHFAPNKDIASAEQCAFVRAFAKEQGIGHFYDVGQMGIEHALLPEQGLIRPGELIVGADSHTCTYGALNAFGTGVGSTDLAGVLATGKIWLKVPKTMGIRLSGKLAPFVSGKDVILFLLSKIGVEGARYLAMEWFGQGLAALSMDSRLTICNMAVEAGAKCGIFDFDAITQEYLAAHAPGAAYAPVHADANAAYDQLLSIDLSTIPCMVALPHSPGNAIPVAQIKETAIQQVVIGSCTNGRLEDLQTAATILAGKKIAKGLRAIVIPATQQIYLEAMRRGYLEIFIQAGCAVSTPTCGPCLGGHMGILANGESCVATTNRNFVGRMGHAGSKVYLANPAVAAASALLGRVAQPSDLE